MDGAPASEVSMVLVLLDEHGEPQILLGGQREPGSAGPPPDGGNPEATLQ